MEHTVYKNLDLRIEAIGATNSYKVSASSDNEGNGTCTFTLDELKFDSTPANQQPEGSDRRVILISTSATNEVALLETRPPSMPKARAFGKQLFEAVFKGPVLLVFDRCMKAKQKNVQLRIRLNLTSVPNLAGLPWEFLCPVPANNFFTRAYDSMVRYLEVDSPFDDSPLTEPPLRILVVVSNPRDVPPLDVEGELANLKEAVQQLEANQQIVLDTLDKPTLKSLRLRLHERRKNNAPYHVFHFIGHGVFDSSSKQGKLLLETETGEASPVSAQELGETLAAHGSFRLAVINACEGARTSPCDSFSGVAQTFLRSEAVPAVIAMQYRISDTAAKTFSQRFYEELVRGEDTDTAVTLARTSISDSKPERDDNDDAPVEWGTPVLYLRAKDSRLVDFPAASQESADKIKPPPVSSKPGALDAHYQEIVEALLFGKLVPFLGLDVNLFDRTTALRPPAYGELVQHLTKFGKYPYNLGAPLAGVSQYAQLPNRIANLYEQLAPLFNDQQYKPTPLHEFWAQVAKKRVDESKVLDSMRRRFVIVTMSYDELLEQAFSKIVERFYVFSYIADGGDQERGKFFRTLYQKGAPNNSLIVDADNKELTDELPVILKLPGTSGFFNAKIRFAITEDQYVDLLTTRELTSILPSQVMTKLRGCHHLFMGYNVSDWNTRGMLYRIWEKHEPPYQPSWVVHEGLPEFERKYWEACRVDIIKEHLAQYVAELNARLI
jgi:hypothetical protein